MSGGRLVAVLGYSRGGRRELHPICAARLARAAAEAQEHDVVLVSGRAEAELMAGAWRGRPARLILDDCARSTLGNVVGAAAAARDLDAREVVLVTSAWHSRRASVLLRAALRGTGASLRPAPAGDPCRPGARIRELACWALVPFQAALAARRRSLH